eukprot:TRINITY_DN4783_c0_g1_i2.p1 TRINITY_DN4783_c0_g1~~TRINITY_DN4783_c0_g1_i2.p1  ORF type:complete len:108 (-),score=26.14 TRINITY_DN4783_c0_g1_i2:5-328(-)
MMSDHTRRSYIVGDYFENENQDDLTSVLYVGFNTGITLPDEEKILNFFSKFGEVRWVSRYEPNPGVLRSYALVEFSSVGEAKKARHITSIKDKSGEIRQGLGPCTLR